MRYRYAVMCYPYPFYALRGGHGDTNYLSQSLIRAWPPTTHYYDAARFLTITCYSTYNNNKKLVLVKLKLLRSTIIIIVVPGRVRRFRAKNNLQTVAAVLLQLLNISWTHYKQSSEHLKPESGEAGAIFKTTYLNGSLTYVCTYLLQQYQIRIYII